MHWCVLLIETYVSLSPKIQQAIYSIFTTICKFASLTYWVVKLLITENHYLWMLFSTHSEIFHPIVATASSLALHNTLETNLLLVALTNRIPVLYFITASWIFIRRCSNFIASSNCPFSKIKINSEFTLNRKKMTYNVSAFILLMQK